MPQDFGPINGDNEDKLYYSIVLSRERSCSDLHKLFAYDDESSDT